MITNEADYTQELAMIAAASQELSRVVVGRPLSIDTITIFAQTEEEFVFISKLLDSYGQRSPLSHAKTQYNECQMVIGTFMINLLGVRQPDETRPERGYADYPVKDYVAIKLELAGNQFVEPIISGREQELLELRHPDFNIRGYIIGDH